MRDSLSIINILAKGAQADQPEGNVLEISFEQQISLTAVKFELWGTIYCKIFSNSVCYKHAWNTETEGGTAWITAKL